MALLEAKNITKRFGGVTALDDLMGPVLVVELPESLQQIHAADPEQAGIPADTRRMLFKTRNSKAWERKQTRF